MFRTVQARLIFLFMLFSLIPLVVLYVGLGFPKFTGTIVTAVLVSLASNASILKVVFDKKKLKERKARIEKIANGEVTGQATKAAIQAMQAAVVVACIVPTVVVSS